jgi:hypothetical protein
MGSLGAYLGLPKCKLTPEQILKWLGFMIDTFKEVFTVGEKKIEKLKEALAEVIGKPTTMPGELAGIAGKIIATSPAVMPAALFSRSLFQAMKGRISWDEIFPIPQSVSQTARFWLNNIDRINARKWWPKPVALRVDVNASGIGFGGYLHMEKKTIPFTGTCTK